MRISIVLYEFPFSILTARSATLLILLISFLVLEYAPGGELFDYLVSKGALDTGMALKIFQQIIEGLDHCHQHFVW
jgi:serine/threonine protein kinase